jgi:hypothetical protein
MAIETATDLARRIEEIGQGYVEPYQLRWELADHVPRLAVHDHDGECIVESDYLVVDRIENPWS